MNKRHLYTSLDKRILKNKNIIFDLKSDMNSSFLHNNKNTLTTILSRKIAVFHFMLLCMFFFQSWISKRQNIISLSAEGSAAQGLTPFTARPLAKRHFSFHTGELRRSLQHLLYVPWTEVNSITQEAQCVDLRVKHQEHIQHWNSLSINVRHYAFTAAALKAVSSLPWQSAIAYRGLMYSKTTL